jgi:hypothetical protein
MQHEITKIGSLITNRGSKLLHYEAGRAASIQLPSQEVLIVSIGTATMKVFCKARFFGWMWPKAILSVDLISIGWYECIPLTRVIVSVLLIAKTIDLLTNARSTNEIIQKYGDNFVAKLMEAMEEDLVEDCFKNQ